VLNHSLLAGISEETGEDDGIKIFAKQ